MALDRLGICGLALLAVLTALAAMLDSVAAQQPTPEQIESIRQSCSGVQPGGREALQCLEQNASRLSPACSNAISAAATDPAPPPPASAQPQPPPAQPSDQNQLSAVRQSCTLNDYLSHCSWINPSSPELLLCLRANAAQVSPNCQAAMRASTDTATPGTNMALPVAAPPSAPPVAATPAQPQVTTTTRQPSSKQISAVRTACRSDFIAHCSGVQPGTRDALLCLEANKAALSKACGAALAALGGSGAGAASSPDSGTPAATPAPESFPLRNLGPRQELGVLRACAADARSLCADTPPGGGRIIRCLARNASQLSPQCRAALVARLR
jgi:hypothetical protein